MNTSLLFLDECHGHEQTKIVSMTGLRVPVEKADGVRTAFVEMMMSRLKLKREGYVETTLPELHAKSLLKNDHNIDDDTRLGIFQDIVNIVLDSKLSIHRVGYYVSSALRASFDDPTDRFAFVHAWHGIAYTLQPYLENNYVIPVMDRIDDRLRIRQLCDLPMFGLMVRAQGHGEMLSIKGTERILSEVLFADHRHSLLTQIVDVCSYLRHTCDRSRANAIDTDFKRRLADIGAGLEPMIAAEKIVVMIFDGKPTGPASVNFKLVNERLLDPAYH